MSSQMLRGTFAAAALAAGFALSGTAEAQVVVVPSPSNPSRSAPNGLGTGVQYDIANRNKAERRLRRVDGRDERRVAELRQRIAVDGWLIRKNLQCEPGPYPLRIDTVSACAIADAARPVPSAYLPMPTVAPLAPNARP